MTPDERQLLSGLFERTRQAGDQPRDREAEALIQQAISQQPYAPYLLAQTVLVQEQALRAANERLQQLEAENRELQARGAGQSAPAQESGTSFLGGLGKSLFGGGAGSAAASGAPRGPWGQTSAPPPQQQGWGQQAPPQQGWGAPPPQAAPSGGSSFLHGALGTAAGVAGGVLLANSIRGLFSGGSNPMGIGSGFGGGTPGAPIGGETIVNNYYEGGSDQGYDRGGDTGTQDASWSSDDSSDDSGSDWGGDTGSSDDSYDV